MYWYTSVMLALHILFCLDHISIHLSCLHHISAHMYCLQHTLVHMSCLHYTSPSLLTPHSGTTVQVTPHINRYVVLATRKDIRLFLLRYTLNIFQAWTKNWYIQSSCILYRYICTVYTKHSNICSTSITYRYICPGYTKYPTGSTIRNGFKGFSFLLSLN